MLNMQDQAKQAPAMGTGSEALDQGECRTPAERLEEAKFAKLILVTAHKMAQDHIARCLPPGTRVVDVDGETAEVIGPGAEPLELLVECYPRWSRRMWSLDDIREILL